MQGLIQLALLACSLSIASCARNFSDIYPFKATLNTAEDGGLYELYWTFDNAAETISFAVRVQTTGWVGFGISPNGQMPNSDVVIGWVKDGNTFFHDRFATSRNSPAIDDQQDWELEDGYEEDGFTVLKFTRKYITCDDKDLPITSETARVIWSFRKTDDPTSEDIPFSLIHTEKGSLSLNLLGGLPVSPPVPDDLQYIDITVSNVTIPEHDTTYWCAAFKLPEDIRDQTQYVTKFGPVVTEGNEAHVHHLLIYLCDSITDAHVGNGANCMDDVANEIRECVGGTLIAAWAVGGEDFLFPENVAFPLGGEGTPQYLVMELHYDNPQMIQGTKDSSGMRIWYTSSPREYDAGIFEVGYFVHRYMVIPPNAKNFTITGVSLDDCTTKYLPEDGIHVFANILHTHLAGHGLTLQHLRYNSDCDVYEELEPIDRNLQYDFDFQQIIHLPREKIIMPGDILQLKCFYGTEGVDGVTIGGLSTRDEMCLAFFLYYPKVNATVSLSRIRDEDYFEYLKNLPPDAYDMILQGQYVEGLNSVDWDEDRRHGLELTLHNSTQISYCGDPGGDSRDSVSGTTKLPEIGCPYIPPDQCTGFTPPPCCDRLSAGVTLTATTALLLVLSLLAAIL